MMQQPGYVDLHTHTTASDGMQSPAENVRIAKAAGLAGIAITDHDTVAGIREAMQEGEKLGVTVVPGVEISTVLEGKDIHVLGYFIDDQDPIFLERLADLRATRDRRNDMLIAKLQELGIDITMDEVIAGLGRELAPDETVGRPHIADVLVKKGYATDMRNAFDVYLGAEGKAYVNPPRIEPLTAVKWIREAGGTPVLAHPGLYGDDVLVERILQETRIAGIEVYHSDHLEPEEFRYRKLAEKYHLIITAGSDFHGARQGVVFHGELGGRRTTIDVLDALVQARS
ncbi:phosphatase [Paenibacillus selenitireducens]|uniref:Phosphatase n=1 Tax=Paenibacillus selenitireducens TaxID=1324314 RepID=A0A1T2XFG0_9BACL|nr:PHP domain-containing protein [Paenibacillus selenitireducens]OPA78568.1 phosphatase [Paenibacillus selenitireducens]